MRWTCRFKRCNVPADHKARMNAWLGVNEPKGNRELNYYQGIIGQRSHKVR